MRSIITLLGLLMMMFWSSTFAVVLIFIFEISPNLFSDEPIMKVIMAYLFLFFLPFTYDSRSNADIFYERGEMNLVLGIFYMLIFALIHYLNQWQSAAFLWGVLIFFGVMLKTALNASVDTIDEKRKSRHFGSIVSKETIQALRKKANSSTLDLLKPVKLQKKETIDLNSDHEDFNRFERDRFSKLEQWLLSEIQGPVATLLKWMPESRRHELNQESKLEAKIQIERLIRLLNQNQQMYEQTGMESLPAQQEALRDIFGLN
ncbi:MAG: hypothetical protein HOP37_09230 [Cyclobacteriaceae bacterium]|nr:hypothetical protein [Cyclobacteriaceae bacterium]